MRTTFLSFLTLLTLAVTSVASAQDRLIEPFLATGDLVSAQRAVLQQLRKTPGVPELQFQLALVQLLQGVEAYAQGMHRMGLQESLFGGMVPFLRFPVEPNLEPSVATNAEVREAIGSLAQSLSETRTTLAEIPDSWPGRLPLKLGRVRIDFDGDGVAGPKEELWRLVMALNPGMRIDEEKARQFGIHLDAGDARWLEGYTHVLMGLADTGLAYDTQRLFDHTGNLFFAYAATPFPFLARGPLSEGERNGFYNSLVDGIAFIHLLDLPLLDAARLSSALAHFREVLSLSRRSWACIMAETDNEFEWIPNPNQQSVIPDWTVTTDMVEQWLEFLKEGDSVLAGESLLPFWRSIPDGQGLNLARVFLEPQPFDLVLWLQGTAAVPYLEEGRVVPQEVWTRINQAFGGQFFGFAVWFN